MRTVSFELDEETYAAVERDAQGSGKTVAELYAADAVARRRAYDLFVVEDTKRRLRERFTGLPLDVQQRILGCTDEQIVAALDALAQQG